MANKGEVVMQYLTKIWFRIFLLGCVAVLSGCSSSDMTPYLKTFDKILTNQYIEAYSQGGIYWVSNEQVVLEAYIRNDQGVLDRGLYQVDVRDGAYLKVVDIPDKDPTTYKFCFDGSVLHVMTARGIFKKVNSPKEYQVKISELVKKNKRNNYSPLRCGFVDTPKGTRVSYIPLSFDDGFIKNQAGETKTDSVRIFLSDDSGSNLKELSGLMLDSRGFIGVRKYVPHMDAYFGNTSFNRNCTYLTWLYREDWKLEQKELCLKDWSAGSILVHNIKDALYLEHYTSRSSNTYVLQGDIEVVIEEGTGRGATASPNGCMVAYGEDNRHGVSKVRQKLKIFNYCDYQQKVGKS
jgi:hypothetical protein